MSPYSGVNDETLPSYIKTKSEAVKSKWVTIFNAVYTDAGEEAAFIAANSWLKRQAKEIVARSTSSRTRVVFKISEKELIKRSDDGEDYLTAVLATDEKHEDGKKFTPELLPVGKESKLTVQFVYILNAVLERSILF